MNKWTFFLDIDGTVAINGKISDENIVAINEAIQKGHYVFICTGRPYAMIGDVILNAANWSGVICSMGAEVILGKKLIRKETVSEEFAKTVAAEIFKTNVRAVMGNGENCLSLNRKSEDFVRVYNTEDFGTALRGITKIDFFPEVPKEIAELICKEMYIFYHDTYCEAAVKGVSKSKGIAFVLEQLNIPQNLSVAVGDSMNDIDMIKYAGIGVAMANALDEVKQAADRITASAEEHGVAKIIREITNN